MGNKLSHERESRGRLTIFTKHTQRILKLAEALLSYLKLLKGTQSNWGEQKISRTTYC